MYIISKTPSEFGYPALQTWSSVNPPAGYYEYPAAFYSVFYPSDKRAAGFVTLTVDNGKVVNVEWDEEAYQKWAEENPETEPDTLTASKIARIQQSKTDLAEYLATHPLQWMDGNYYSITAEKQAQLTSKIMAATMAAQTSIPYTLTWNSTGEVCKEWSLSDLSALAFAIDKRVTALVSYQQTQEVAMRNAETQYELDGIVVDYDTVQ